MPSPVMPPPRPIPAICTLPAGHDGDCNGFPRIVAINGDPLLDVYCRPLVRRFDPDGRFHVPYSGPREKSLGEYVRERLDLIETHEETIRELRTTIERLERALRNERDPKTWPDWARSVDPQGAGK